MLSEFCCVSACRETQGHRCVDFEGVERLALVLGAEIASTFENPSSIRLGSCKLIEEIMIGEDKLIHFSGVSLGEACTIVLRGANSHLLEEAERSMHDALCVLSQTVANKGVIYGGGNPEISMARGIDEVAAKTPGAVRKDCRASPLFCAIRCSSRCFLAPTPFSM